MSISISPASDAGQLVKPGNTVQTVKAEAAKSAKSVKADEAIEKFEGMFMSMILKEMRKSGTEEGFFPGDQSDTYGGMFDMFVGDHLAKSSDMGLETLFQSSAALKQLEEHVAPQMLSAPNQSRGIEEYRNEQFRAGATITSTGI